MKIIFFILLTFSFSSFAEDEQTFNFKHFSKAQERKMTHHEKLANSFVGRNIHDADVNFGPKIDMHISKVHNTDYHVYYLCKDGMAKCDCKIAFLELYGKIKAWDIVGKDCN